MWITRRDVSGPLSVVKQGSQAVFATDNGPLTTSKYGVVMDCRQAQSVLALAVGQDACDPAAEQAVRAHLTACPVCRQTQRDLEIAHAALLESRTQPAFRRGLWPQVAACIAEWECRPQFARFNVWVPSLAAVAACLLLVSVAVFEVDQHAGRLLPSVVLDQPSASRNLYESDPNFTADRGEVISARDIARWRQTQERTQPVGWGRRPAWPAD
jgi:hypothetical protein